MKYTRFGFNGKEFDWEVKAWQNQYDYGMRVYDPRIGKFLSVDPLKKDYPWYTPYQFAGNKPIYALDLDGAEEMPYMDQFQYDGSWGWFDRLKAVPNVAGRLWNAAVVDTWNSVDATTKSLKRGTYIQDLGNEVGQVGAGIKKYFVDGYNYHTTKSLKQQLNDAINYFTNPKTLEDGLFNIANIYVGNKLLVFRNKLLTPTNAQAILPTADDIFSMSISTRGAAERYALGTKYKGYFNANEFIQSNNPSFDLISSLEKKIVDVTTTTSQKLTPSNFYKKLRALDAAATGGYTGHLQIYIKAGQYSAEQLGNLSKKLDDYIKNAGLNTTYSVDPIK